MRFLLKDFAIILGGSLAAFISLPLLVNDTIFAGIPIACFYVAVYGVWEALNTTKHLLWWCNCKRHDDDWNELDKEYCDDDWCD